MERLRTMVILLLGVQYTGRHLDSLDTHIPAFGVQAEFFFTGVPKDRFVQLGDINIGVLQSFTYPSKDGDTCTSDVTIRGSGATVAYAVETINKQRWLPNNLTLGFVLLNDCLSKRVTAASTVAFLPSAGCPAAGANASDDGNQTMYDVIAVIGSSSSEQTITLTRLLGPAQVPVISVFATSEELSNARRFPYFLRLVPPDRHQFRAIAKTIITLGWSYVSVVYQDGSYGENGFSLLRDFLAENNTCLAVTREFKGTSDEEAESIAKDLVEKHAQARVVVMILHSQQVQQVILATQRLLPDNATFVWIGTDSWAREIENLLNLELLQDSLVFDFYVPKVPQFDEYFVQLRPNKSTSPWFRYTWQDYFHCSLDDGTCNTANSHLPAHVVNAPVGYIIDTIDMIANATIRVLQSHCGGKTGSAARECVTGPQLLQELKASRGTGLTGRLELNANGDRLGFYDIMQWRAVSSDRYERKVVFQYDSTTEQIQTISNITWTEKSLLPGYSTPLSFCSKPCEAHSARILGKVPCCWKCQRCGFNQHVDVNDRSCQLCPSLTGPNPETGFTTCSSLQSRTLGADRLRGVVLLILAALGLAASFAIFLFFFRHRHNPAFVAGCPELYSMMILIMMAGYLNIVPFFLTPTNQTCKLMYFFYTTSITALYGTMLVRGFYIFRVRVRISSAPPSREVRIRRQVIFTILITLVQAGMCSLLMSLSVTWHKKVQANLWKPNVDHTCTVPQEGTLSFLTYNAILLVLCMVVTFYTPDESDKESPAIFTCTSSILIIWGCFIPAYLVARDEVQKTLILVLFLFFNHFVPFLFILLPKVQAMWGEQQQMGTASEAMNSIASKPSFTFQYTKESTAGTKESNSGLFTEPGSMVTFECRGDGRCSSASQ